MIYMTWKCPINKEAGLFSSPAFSFGFIFIIFLSALQYYINYYAIY